MPCFEKEEVGESTDAPNFTKKVMNKITFKNQLCGFPPHSAQWVALLQTIVLNSACTRVLCKNESIDIFFILSILSAFVAIVFSKMSRYDFYITEILRLCLFVSLYLFRFCFFFFLFVWGFGFFSSWFWFDLSKNLYLLLHQNNTKHI